MYSLFFYTLVKFLDFLGDFPIKVIFPIFLRDMPTLKSSVYPRILGLYGNFEEMSGDHEKSKGNPHPNATVPPGNKTLRKGLSTTIIP